MQEQAVGAEDMRVAAATPQSLLADINEAADVAIECYGHIEDTDKQAAGTKIAGCVAWVKLGRTLNRVPTAWTLNDGERLAVERAAVQKARATFIRFTASKTDRQRMAKYKRYRSIAQCATQLRAYLPLLPPSVENLYEIARAFELDAENVKQAFKDGNITPQSTRQELRDIRNAGRQEPSKDGDKPRNKGGRPPRSVPAPVQAGSQTRQATAAAPPVETTADILNQNFGISESAVAARAAGASSAAPDRQPAQSAPVGSRSVTQPPEAQPSVLGGSGWMTGTSVDFLQGTDKPLELVQGQTGAVVQQAPTVAVITG
jgi:hypothetical protein